MALTTIGTTKVTGAAELDRVLKQLPKVIAKRVLNTAVFAAARPIQIESQLRAPVRQSGGVKRRSKGRVRIPGFLKFNIVRSRPKGTVGVVRVGPAKDAFYGRFYELGTRHQAARPFLRPAFEAKKAAALDIMGKRLGAGLERAALKLAGPLAKSGLVKRPRRR